MDGSQVSEKAVEEAFALASAFGVGLDVVHAWSGEKQHGLAHASKYVDWTAYEEGEKAIVSECLAGIRDEYPDVPVNAVTTQGCPPTSCCGTRRGRNCWWSEATAAARCWVPCSDPSARIWCTTHPVPSSSAGLGSDTVRAGLGSDTVRAARQ